MMCGKANCMQRTRVFLSPIDDDSFTMRKDEKRGAKGNGVEKGK
jgi:hypothetical protein